MGIGLGNPDRATAERQASRAMQAARQLQRTQLTTAQAQRAQAAVAGIGNPPRFFAMLEQQGITLSETQAFQDHQAFTVSLFDKFDKNQPLFKTEKDAVKCLAFAQENWWYVPVTTEIQGNKTQQLIQKIAQKCGQKSK